MWTNRVLMCGIDILLCLWAVYCELPEKVPPKQN